MTIITISRGSYSRGKEVAEKLAQQLGYDCISRDDIIEEAAGEFNTPEVKLIRAIHDAPTILDRFTYGKERYIAYFKAAFLSKVQRGNVIYHGLAGHFFLRGLSQVMKVRIIAPLEDRIREEMKKEGISYHTARKLLVKDDEERRKWSLHLYGIDTQNAGLYDLIINVKRLTTDDAAVTIARLVQSKRFSITEESQRKLEDYLLEARVTAILINEKPDIQVKAENGRVRVKTQSLVSHREHTITRFKELTKDIPHLKSIEFDVKSMTP